MRQTMQASKPIVFSGMMFTDPCTFALQSDQELMAIHTEPMFLLHGQFHRANGWIMNDCLSYIAATKEDAIATCKRLNPNFEIQSITVCQ